ncbi:hypothetical protein ACVXHA_22450 [Escherichia coli]
MKRKIPDDTKVIRHDIGNQQLVHTTNKQVRIFQRAAFCQQRLIQQQFYPLAELGFIFSICRTFHQYVIRVSSKMYFTSGTFWPAAANSFAI